MLKIAKDLIDEAWKAGKTVFASKKNIADAAAAVIGKLEKAVKGLARDRDNLLLQNERMREELKAIKVDYKKVHQKNRDLEAELKSAKIDRELIKDLWSELQKCRKTPQIKIVEKIIEVTQPLKIIERAEEVEEIEEEEKKEKNSFRRHMENLLKQTTKIDIRG